MKNLKNNEPFIVRYANFESTKVIDEKGQFHNNIKTYEALKRSRELGLDLVCFNQPEGKDLAFCKIIDFLKWKYEEEKRKKKESKINRKDNKEIRLSPLIADNDIMHKMKQVNNFLDDGDDVTLTMKLKGRERYHFSEAQEKMNSILKMCDGHGKEVSRKQTGDMIIIHLVKAK